MNFDQPLTVCPLCRSDRLGDYDRDFTGRSVSRCGNCRVQFMNPQYTDGYLADYYAEYYAEEAAKSDHADARAPNSIARQRTTKRRHLEIVNRFVQPGRLLSIGCGQGVELELAAEAGWSVEGYDVDPQTVDAVQRRLGVPVYSGDFAAVEFTPDAYDCVFMDQVLEHPKQPQRYLERIRDLLRPGGVLFIACPNIGSLANRWKTSLGMLGLKRRRGRHYDMFHHLFFYDPAVLREILVTHYGYQVPWIGGAPTVLGDRLGWIDRLRVAFPSLESSFALVARRPA